MPRYRRFRGPLVGPGGEIWWPREPRRRPRRWRRTDALERRFREAPLPGRPARGAPVRGYHDYDLDYGLRMGGPFEYSGRAGYPLPCGARPPERRWPPRPEDESYAWPRGTLTERVTESYGRYGRGYDYDEGYATVYRPRRRPRYEHRHWSAAEPSGYGRYDGPFDYW